MSLKNYIQSILGGNPIGQGSGGSGGAGAAGQYNANSNSWVSQGSLSTSRQLIAGGYSGIASGIHGIPGGGALWAIPDISHLPPNCLDYSNQFSIGYNTPSSIFYDPATGDTYIVTPGIAEVSRFGLSSDEKEQLKNLEEDRKKATKQAKINYFKKLPASMRQQVVDNIMWNSAVDAINAEDTPKSEEQKALEQKDVHSAYSGGLGGLSYGGMLTTHMSGLSSQIMGVDYSNYSSIRLPNGITAEELVRAHAEATCEEELLGTDTESK